MNRRWVIAAILLIVGCGSAYACLHIGKPAVSYAASGSGPAPTTEGILAIIATAFASLGAPSGIVMAVLNVLHKIPVFQGGLGGDVLDLGAVVTYSQCYKKATNTTEKASAKAAAKALLDDKFVEWFPDSGGAK